MIQDALKFLSGGTTSIVLGILLLILGIWYASWKSDYEKKKAIEETDNAKSKDQQLGREIQKTIDQDDAAAKKAVDDFLDPPSV